LYSCRKACGFFVFLPLKGKQKGSKLSVLCAFAVNSIQTKTLLGEVADCLTSASSLSVKVSIDLPEHAFSALRMRPDNLVKEVRLAATIE